MFKRDTFYLILILVGVVWFAEVYSSPFAKNKFEIAIKGSRGDLDYLKLKAEYRTLKKSRYCKGAFISYSNTKWQCDNEGSPKCTKKFRCKRVNKNFNIRTESIRIRNAMQKTGMIKPRRHKIWISQKPRPKKRKNTTERELSPSTFSDVQYLGTGPIRGMVYGTDPEQRDSQLAQKKITATELKEKMGEADAMAELREERKQLVAEKIAKKGFKKIKRVEDVAKSDSMDELEKIDDDEFQEALDVSEDSTESDIDIIEEPEETQVMASNDSNESGDQSLFQILSFSAGYLNISDAEQSLSTIEVAWTPRIKFGGNSTFGLRGHYGFHQYSLPEAALATAEVIIITDMKILLYKYLGNFILEAGVGSQSWGGTIGLSFSTISGTLGYKFDKNILKAVDRVYVHAMQIAATEPTTSIEFGIGISF